MTERIRERDTQLKLYVRDTVEYTERREQERKRSRIIVRAGEVKPEWNGHGHTYLIVDQDTGFTSIKTLQAFIQEIPPGGHNLMHKHDCEAIIHFLSGKGYSLIDEKKYEWEAGDTISVPDNAWHQHFNIDPEKPARFFAVTNIPLMKALGKFSMVDKEFSEKPLR